MAVSLIGLIPAGGVQAKSGELTVCDGEEKSSYVPFYGYYADTEHMVQFIIPATMLTEMNGKYVSSLTFYLAYDNYSDYNYSSNFTVTLCEVDNTTFDSTTPQFYPVPEIPSYEGKISLKDCKVKVELDKAFCYQGGNLLVTFHCDGTGGWNSITFAGVEADKASAFEEIYDSGSYAAPQNQNNSSKKALTDADEEVLGDYGVSVMNFIPKTTFTYYDKADFVNVIFQAPGGKPIAEYDRIKNSVITPPAIKKYGSFIITGWSVDGKIFDFSKPVSKDTVFTAILSEYKEYLYEDFEDYYYQDHGWTNKAESGKGNYYLHNNYPEDGMDGYYSYCQDSYGSLVELISTSLDLSEAYNVHVSFLYKCSRYLGDENEAFYVSYLNESGEWVDMYEDTEVEPLDKPTYYGPYNVDVTVPEEAYYDGVQFRFVSFGSNVQKGSFYADQTSYLDDILIYQCGHDFEYTAKGNVITAECVNEECSLFGEKATLTIKASDSKYTGKAVKAGVVLNEIWTEANGLVTDYEIEYYKGTKKLSSPPVDPGAYTAQVTIEGATAVAKYSIGKAFTVTFDANGHGKAPAAQKVAEGAKAKKPTDPKATGYTFGGWYTDKKCTKAYNFNTPVTKNITLYAKWTVTVKTVDMLRLYNPNSGEHFYTASAAEKDNLVKAGWKYEGIAWKAPTTSKTPVYRLYNKNAGDHHYTISASEKENLVKAGWQYEGIGWYSDDAKGVPLYRLYNPNATAGSHHYTTSAAEKTDLVKAGWKDEGIAWYGVK